MKIALDAMGGDNAPRAVIEGALLARGEIESAIVLVGGEAAISAHLAELSSYAQGGIELCDAPEHIEMGEPLARAIRKSHSSIHVAARLVKTEVAGAFVSMGHSGAVMAVCSKSLGRIKGVKRPALGAMIPTLLGSSVLIDVGANVNPKLINLLQFGVMGAAFYAAAKGVERPTVGLLSNGEEEIKGNVITQKAHRLLKDSQLNYKGYVEGRDILTGEVDIIVCDGFVGNIMLKMAEGFVELLPKFMMQGILADGDSPDTAQNIAQNITEGTADRELKTSVEKLKGMLREKFDYNEYGGAPLLGLKGVCIMGHGRSNSTAVKNALIMADRFMKSGMIPRIEQGIEQEISRIY